MLTRLILSKFTKWLKHYDKTRLFYAKLKPRKSTTWLLNHIGNERRNSSISTQRIVSIGSAAERRDGLAHTATNSSLIRSPKTSHHKASS